MTNKTSKIKLQIKFVTLLKEKKINSFFSKEINKNIRLVFNYYNICKSQQLNMNKLDLINKYFFNKNLIPIEKVSILNPLITLKKEVSIIDTIKTSVIITNYNNDTLLYNSINSLINQTYKNLEIIVVNDGSNDKSINVLLSIKRIYPNRIKIVNLRNNYGTYIAKNIGITFATGKLITFHDSDDWAHPQRIEEHVKHHIKNKNIKYSISKLVRITEDGYFYSKEIYPLDRLSMVSLMIDKSILGEIGYFRNHRLGSDTEYFERLKKFTNHKFMRIDKVLMFCSHRENSLTTSKDTGVVGFAKNNKRQHYWNKWNNWHKKLLKAKRKPFVKFDREKYDYEIIK